jgi:tripartite-type tricarboxylate transporter receptor subunit TctC
MMNLIGRFLCLATLIVSPVTHAAAAAGGTDYPSRPLRLIVPWVAGGGTDIVARIISPKLAEGLGQQIIIDNRPGVNGILGSNVAAKATPDGHTMILEAVEHVINASTYVRLPYDTIRDFAPVALVAGHSLVLVVNPSFPGRTLPDLVALAKSKPGQITFGSWGEGSLAHLSGELTKNMAAIDMVHVPYKGAPQALVDVVGGRLSLIFTTMPTGIPLIRAGKLRALTVTSAKRLSYVPEIPTMIESGYPGFEVESWRGTFVPAGTPRRIVARLNGEFVKVLKMPEIRERVTAAGFEPMTSTPEQLDAFSKSELAKWAKVAKAAGVRIE